MRYVRIADGVVVNATNFDDTMPEGWDAPNEWLPSEEAGIGWSYDGDTFTAPISALPPGSGVPHLNSGGLARFSGTAPVAVYEAIRMAGVTRISKGRYRVTHETPMPSDQYSVGLAVMDALPRTVRYTARTANYVEVRVTDLAGAVQDPAEITVSTQRVVQP